MASENRMRSVLAKNSQEIENIQNDEVYRAMADECKRKLEEIEKAETQQKESVKDYIKQLTESLRKKQNTVTDLVELWEKAQTDFEECEKKLKLSFNEKENIINSRKLEEDFLLSTTKNIYLKHEALKGKFKEINNTKNLVECKGNLSENLYLVRNELDENNMAIVRKAKMNCKPTVCIYEKSCIKENNLSEELSHFVQWLCDSIRRTNPAAILSRFTLVDMTSGRSVLHILPYQEYLDVISDENGKNHLAESLKKREVEITDQCNRKDLLKEESLVDSIDTLNQIKMKINQEDYEQQENIPITELWEQLIPYKIVIFIISPATANSVQPSVLNDILKQSIRNSERFGVLPIFVIDNENWKDGKSNPDITFIKEIHDKNTWEILNVGKNSESRLDFLER